MRDLDSALATEVAKQALQPVLLCIFYFDSYIMRLWSGLGDLVWEDETYTGAGALLAISDIQETVALEANGMNFTLSGIPAGLISLALNEPYQGRRCELYIAALEASSTLIPPYQLFGGRMDVMEISESGDTATITLSAESRLIQLKKSRETRYTKEDQRRRWADDRGLDFIAGLQSKEITWGRKS